MVHSHIQYNWLYIYSISEPNHARNERFVRAKFRRKLVELTKFSSHCSREFQTVRSQNSATDCITKHADSERKKKTIKRNVSSQEHYFDKINSILLTSMIAVYLGCVVCRGPRTRHVTYNVKAKRGNGMYVLCYNKGSMCIVRGSR